MKVKGALKWEKITIIALLLISIFTLCASIFIEFGLQPCLPEVCFTWLHLGFITNVLLGIAGSATISFLCLIFPYLEKTNSLKQSLKNTVNNVYCSYAKMITTIDSNLERPEEDNSYMGEFLLKENTEQFSKSILELRNLYAQIAISSSRVDKILAEAANMLALTEIVNTFLSFAVLKKPDCLSNPVEATKKKDPFDTEENREMYQLLLATMDEMFSRKSMAGLFDGFITYNEAMAVNMKDTSSELVNAYQEKELTDKTVMIRLTMAPKLALIIQNHLHKREEPRNKVFSKLRTMIGIVEKLPKASQEKYCAEFDKIRELMDYKGCTKALALAEKVEAELTGSK